MNPIQSSSSSVDLPACPTQAAQAAPRGSRSCASRITSPQAKASFYLSFYDGTHSMIILRYCDKNAQTYRPPAKSNLIEKTKGAPNSQLPTKRKGFFLGRRQRVAER
jgi:hypothetical protein